MIWSATHGPPPVSGKVGSCCTSDTVAVPCMTHSDTPHCCGAGQAAALMQPAAQHRLAPAAAPWQAPQHTALIRGVRCPCAMHATWSPARTSMHAGELPKRCCMPFSMKSATGCLLQHMRHHAADARCTTVLQCARVGLLMQCLSAGQHVVSCCAIICLCPGYSIRLCKTRCGMLVVCQSRT